MDNRQEWQALAHADILAERKRCDIIHETLVSLHWRLRAVATYLGAPASSILRIVHRNGALREEYLRHRQIGHPTADRMG